MRVLIIDDDEDDFVIIRDVLRAIPGEPIEPTWISDYATACEAACSGQYEVILLDYGLGAHTGLEVLSHKQELNCKTPVILLTGLEDREVDVAAMHAGAVDYLIKSELRPDLLDRAIRYAAERARTQATLDALDQRLLDEHTKLLRAERLSSLGLIAATVAHEINNPLCGVMALVKALRDRGLSDSKFKEYMDTIQDGLERMRGTVQGLLDFVREQPLSIASVDAAEVISECLRLCGAVASKKQIEVKLMLRPTEAMVSADRSRLLQALLNLLLNAVYATPVGGTIECSTLREGRRVGLRVADTGTGIPKEILDRVCEPFFTTKPMGQGTGLGLAVTSSIVRAHKGELKIDSVPGQGTTITIWLPQASRPGAPTTGHAHAHARDEAESPKPGHAADASSSPQQQSMPIGEK